MVPFASMCGCVNRTSHPCGSRENGVAVFAQVALLLQKHLSTALCPIDGQISPPVAHIEDTTSGLYC
jgi:hypothetical protein